MPFSDLVTRIEKPGRFGQIPSKWLLLLRAEYLSEGLFVAKNIQWMERPDPKRRGGH